MSSKQGVRISSNSNVLLVKSENGLSRSKKLCFHNTPTYNPGEGCLFSCLFCTIAHRWKQPNTVRVFVTDFQTVKKELAVIGKRANQPKAILLGTNTDCFQPIEKLLEAAYTSLEFFLTEGFDVFFQTRGMVPEHFGPLLSRYKQKVFPQVSLFSIDKDLVQLYEPKCPSPQDRLESIRRLRKWGLFVSARIDPLIPFVSDTVSHLEELLRHLRSVGITRCSSNYAQLHPHMLESLEQTLPSAHFQLIKGSFKGQAWRKWGVRKTIKLLPEKIRTHGYQRLIHHAKRNGIEATICKCQNSPIGTACLAKPFDTKKAFLRGQLPLFPERTTEM